MDHKRSRWLVVSMGVAMLLFVALVPRLLAAQKTYKSKEPLETRGQSFQRRPSTPELDLRIKLLPLHKRGYVQYEVQNVGRTVAKPVVVTVYVDRVLKDTIRHTQLQGDQTIFGLSKVYPFDGCKGGRVLLIVDEQKSVPETEERNNMASRILAPPCPDLAVAKIRLHAYGGKAPYAALVTVENRGDAAAQNIVVDVYYGHRYTWKVKKYKKRKIIDRLGPGQSEELGRYTRRHSSRYNWVVKVKVDPDNRVRERNERNNVVTWRSAKR